MSKYVSREKYEKLKASANSWMKESRILKNKLETIPELEEEIIYLEEENKKLKDILNNGTFESDMISALKNDNKKIQEKIETLKNQQKDMAESYQNKINNLERDILRKDGKIERLEDAKKDMKERYDELREDIRYQKTYRDEQRRYEKR